MNDQANGNDKGERDSQHERLFRLLAHQPNDIADLFHDGGTPYATIRLLNDSSNQAACETVELSQNRRFTALAAGVYHRAYRGAIGPSVVASALPALQSKALFESREEKVFYRIGRTNDAIYIDNGIPNGFAYKITADGWEPVIKPDIKFIRKSKMSALPATIPNGTPQENIGLLRKYLNTGGDDRLFILMVSWIIGAYSDGPYPILAIHGEKGTAKSTQAAILSRLIDPTEAEKRTLPDEDQGLMIAAKSAYVLSYDNVSKIPDWLSDGLCKLATGASFGSRALYTNDEENIITAKRPIILNGITDFILRGDLQDRAIEITLPIIPEENRRPESEFWAEFEQDKPLILAGIYDALSMAMRNIGSVNLPEYPRMADFAKWINAAEPALPWQKGEFNKIYMENREDATAALLSNNELAQAIIELAGRKTFDGTATELLIELGSPYPDCFCHHWTPTKLGNELRRIAPELRQNGIDIDGPRMTRKRGKPERLITLQKLVIPVSQPVNSQSTLI